MSGISNLLLWELYNEPDRHGELQSMAGRHILPLPYPSWRGECRHVTVCLSVTSNSPLSRILEKKKKVLHSSGSHQLLSWFVPQLQTFRAQVRVGARGCVYFPYGCSRSPLNKTVVPLLSKPTSFVSNEHLPGSLPTTAGFSVSLCQQPMTLILCFITPQRWAPNSSKEWLKYGEGLLCYTNKVVFVHNERTVDEALLCSSHRGF